ncbi:MAG TPA: 23S rRNA (adenine(2503)-C(2))-methyltransferase RlmN, partial [Verrucomicrobiales bacterium]|nr:23S rRNA (adenine(2503)-C(2))-methyltransferase RlmN [Verrucomicrobiales bacterium]
MTREELGARFKAWGQPAYRVDQLLGWLHRERAAGWESMSNLPRGLREQLAGEFQIGLPALVQKKGSRDTTQKFLWRLADGAFVESVLIPASPALYGERSDRHTLCISTQVGCAYGCRFCASGLEGWKRNLTPDEILNQITAVELWHRAQPPAGRLPAAEPVPGLPALPEAPGEEAPDPSRLVNNIVVMGMGEPLANYDNLIRALAILNAPWGGGIGARKITISTSGLAPQIRKLADEPLQFRLAISLHGATDLVREKIMPVNRKYPLRELTSACEYYQEKKGRMITLEYILISGVNDGLDQVKPLAQLARRLHAKVNLIPYNKVEGLPWERPSEAAQEAFLAGVEA